MYTQEQIDYRDLRIGRLTLNLESALAQAQQLKQAVAERDKALAAKDEEIERHKARVLELEEIIAQIADDEDDEAADDEDEVLPAE